MEPGRITARQIEAARVTVNRHVKTSGVECGSVCSLICRFQKSLQKFVWARAKAHRSFWVAAVRAGRILYEMDGVTEEMAREALTLAAAKLPIPHQSCCARGWTMSDMKKAKELRTLSEADLKERMDELAAEHMKLRFQKATMQLTNVSPCWSVCVAKSHVLKPLWLSARSIERCPKQAVTSAPWKGWFVS